MIDEKKFAGIQIMRICLIKGNLNEVRLEFDKILNETLNGQWQKEEKIEIDQA